VRDLTMGEAEVLDAVMLTERRDVCARNSGDADSRWSEESKVGWRDRSKVACSSQAEQRVCVAAACC
jgi:hypothetical protein